MTSIFCPNPEILIFGMYSCRKLKGVSYKVIIGWAFPIMRELLHLSIDEVSVGNDLIVSAGWPTIPPPVLTLQNRHSWQRVWMLLHFPHFRLVGIWNFKMGKKKLTRQKGSSRLSASPIEGQRIPSYNLNSVRSEEDLLLPRNNGMDSVAPRSL